ncbi:MAG: hypothetical protein NTY15_18235 [Planctomycetota bacterium]|nr:hypothetical protein [Planctomycetota bacterium]
MKRPLGIDGTSSDQDKSQDSARGSVLWLSVAIVSLLPGLFFGGLILAFTPINMLEGHASWFVVYPIAYVLLQMSALAARLRSSRRFANITFNVWSVGAIVSSVALIAELQRQIVEFQGECGNVLLGAILIQFASCGTILGMILLTLGDWSGRNQ